MPTTSHPAINLGLTCRTHATGLASALNLNLHFYMLFLDGVYVVGADGTVERFRWVRAPTTAELTELTELTHTTGADLHGRGTAALGLTVRIRPKSPSPADTFPAREAGIPANIVSKAG